MPRIEMIVSPKGETEITVKGAKGARCRELTRKLEAGLGETVGSVDTAEAYEDPEQIRIHQGRG